MNPQIGNFRSSDCVGYDMLDVIAKNCQDLTSISIWNDVALNENHYDGIARLSRSEKLKELQFQYDVACQGPLTSEIQELGHRNTLETLSIADGKLDANLCNALCNMTNIRNMRIILNSLS